MGGGGESYEKWTREGKPAPEDLLLAPRIERVDRVVAGRTRSVTVVLDQLEDTFNMAAVLRTCEAFGVQDVHVIDNPEVRFEPHVKVTQGCDKWLDVQRYRSVAACVTAVKARGYALWVSAVVSAVEKPSESLFSLRFDQRVALAFGNERHGVSAELLAAADGTFWIPMRGFTQSLNISAAVSASVTRAMAWREEHGLGRGDLPPEELELLRQKFYELSVKQRKRLYGPMKR